MMKRWSMGKGWWIRCCTCAVGRDNTHCYSSAMQLQRQGAMTTRQPVERIKRFRNGRRLAACVWQRGWEESCRASLPSARNPESQSAESPVYLSIHVVMYSINQSLVSRNPDPKSPLPYHKKTPPPPPQTDKPIKEIKNNALTVSRSLQLIG